MRLCEMKKSDFKKGQIVYLLWIGDKARYLSDGEIKIEEAIVTSVSNKYITTGEGYSKGQFEVDNRFWEKVNCGSAKYRLLLYPEQLEEEKQAEEYLKNISDNFDNSWGSFKSDLPLEKLKKICDIINE